jgi:sugar phosphate isomerase/epimerase
LHVSVEDQTLTEAGYDSLVAGLSDLGLGAIGLTATASLELPALDADGGPFVLSGDDASARAYRAHVYEHAVEVSALGVAWASPAKARPEQLERIAALAAAMGTIGVRVAWLTVSPEGGPDLPANELARGLAQELGLLLEKAAYVRAVLAVEAPGLADREPAFQRDLLQQTHSEYLGLALDPGGLYASGMPLRAVYDTVSELAPYVRYVRCRNSRRPEELRPETVDAAEARHLYASELEAGDIDYARIASTLGRMGYSGALTVFADFRDGAKPEERQRRLRRDVAYLKDMLGEE